MATKMAIGPAYDGERKIAMEIADELESQGLYAEANSEGPATVTVNGTLDAFNFDWTILHEFGHHIIDINGLRISHEDMDVFTRHLTRILHNSPALCEHFYRRHFPRKGGRK